MLKLVKVRYSDEAARWIPIFESEEGSESRAEIRSKGGDIRLLPKYDKLWWALEAAYKQNPEILIELEQLLSMVQQGSS